MAAKTLRVGVDARLTYYREGGISTYTMGLLRGLAQVVGEGEEIVVLQSRKDRQPRIVGPYLSVAHLWTPPHHRLEQVGLPLELVYRRLDVIHCPDFIPPLRRRCRAVITVHDLAFLLYPHLLTEESQRYYSQIDQAVKSADAIIAVSENTRKDLVERVGAKPEKVVVIPEAADELYRPLEREVVETSLRSRFGLATGYMLFVGTIEPRKNLPFLLRAYATMHERWRSKSIALPKLVIAGRKGWLFEDVFKVVDELRLGDEVRFLGVVSPDDLVLLYNGACLLVFPSLYEGFGLPLLEAMACGTPVIGANVSSIPEVVGDAGLLFSARESEALIAGLENLILDQALANRLRQKGFERVRQFSWKHTAQETLALYRKLA